MRTSLFEIVRLRQTRKETHKIGILGVGHIGKTWVRISAVAALVAGLPGEAVVIDTSNY